MGGHVMRMRIGGLLLALGAWLLPSAVQAQGPPNFNQEVTPMTGYLPGPLGHPRMEDGGFYVALDFLYMRQTNPMGNQVVAIRGFMDVSGNITGTPGTFLGSGETALSTEQIDGPRTFQPGFNIVGGWRFQNGVALQISWMHLWDSRYAAVAALIPPSFNVGGDLANTFLFSPVVNFPIDFAGSPQNVTAGAPGDTFGIWNAASLMGIMLVQRFDMAEIAARIPIWQTENHRTYGLIGPRLVWFWERFSWRTIDADPNGAYDSLFTALYSNVVSNRLYGIFIGGGHDWFMGDTPMGGFGINIDVAGALYYDFVKERAKYTRGDRTIAYSHARNVYRLVPEVEAKVGVMWYPWEAVQVRVGYNLMAFFNTIASPEPIDFNFGTLTPVYKGQARLLEGIDFGFAFVF